MAIIHYFEHTPIYIRIEIITHKVTTSHPFHVHVVHVLADGSVLEGPFAGRAGVNDERGRASRMSGENCGQACLEMIVDDKHFLRISEAVSTCGRR